MRLSARAILTEALRDFRRAWPQLIAADLIARILALVALTPLVGVLLKVFLATTATGVVTDGAIVGFLLHPTGFTALLVVGSLSLAVLLAETGQLMVIGFGAIEGRNVPWFTALKYALRRVSSLTNLAWLVVVRLMLIALPFLAAVGALYWFGLRKYGFQYYLAEKPPEFKAVVAVTGLLMVMMAHWMIVRIAGWLLALPMVLFDGLHARQAMRASEKAIAAHHRRVVVWLVAWVVALVLLSLFVNVIAGRLGNAIIPRNGSDFTLLLIGLSALLVVSALAHLVIFVFATVLFPLVVVRLYCSLAGPGALRTEVTAAITLDERAAWKLPGKSILVTSSVALGLIAAACFLFMRSLDWPDHSQIIAHRGGAAVAPENTMAAFNRGITDGAAWLELDVQENADGVVVVVHDRDFMRISNTKLDVYQATTAELNDLDVGSFFKPEFADQRAPTLRDVLQLAKGKVGLFIELKYYGHDQSLEARVVELVEKEGMAADIVVMSLEYDGVRKTAGLRPGWTYGLLNAVAIGDLTRLDVDFLALAASAATFSTIHEARRRGMKVYAWTINDPVQMWVMMSRGVDGIITDNVALARQVQDLRAKMTPFGRFLIWMAGESGLLRGVNRSSSRDEA